MSRRSRIWLAVAVLFIVVNVIGAVMAALQGELLHTGIHAGMVLLGEYLVWRLVAQRVARY